MPTLFYQGLQSCREPQLKETTTLKLKLATPNSMGIIGVPTTSTKQVNEDCHNDNATNEITSNPDLGCWNFLQSLATSPQNPKNAMDIATTYGPSSSPLRLSQKSLEICTENLGSETGSDDSNESSIFSVSPTDSLHEKMQPGEEHSSRLFSSTKKVMNSPSFPPPLTTRCGSSCIQVRPHREGGRLVIEAVEAPSRRTYFEAERSDGRLKLRLVENCELLCDKEVSSLENEENNESDNDNEEFKNDENLEEKQRKNEEESGACLKIVGENGAYIKKDMDGKRKDVGVEMEKEKFQRPSRCKESGHCSDNGLCKWEPFWVATS